MKHEPSDLTHYLALRERALELCRGYCQAVIDQCGIILRLASAGYLCQKTPEYLPGTAELLLSEWQPDPRIARVIPVEWLAEVRSYTNRCRKAMIKVQRDDRAHERYMRYLRAQIQTPRKKEKFPTMLRSIEVRHAFEAYIESGQKPTVKKIANRVGAPERTVRRYMAPLLLAYRERSRYAPRNTSDPAHAPPRAES